MKAAGKEQDIIVADRSADRIADKVVAYKVARKAQRTRTHFGFRK